MAGLIIDIIKKLLISLLIVSALGKVFDQLLTFGESELQSLVVLTFYVYCALSLFLASDHKLFHVIALPFFTQFIHLFQRYSFEGGANSIWRLLPFVLLCIYFIHFFTLKTNALTYSEKWFLVFWIVFNVFFLAISPNLGNILYGGFLLFLVILPFYFTYLATVSKAIDFSKSLEMYFFLLYIILSTGTFGLVVAGASYKGSENLLATRNITDTNVTMAYFILLWPLVLLFCASSRYYILLILSCIVIFASIVLISFSRGAVMLITPYLLVSTAMIIGQARFWTILIIGLFGGLYFANVTDAMKDWDMTYFWTLRFGDIFTTGSVLTKLQETSGRSEIHAIAYNLFQISPIYGHGIASFEVLGPGYREAHSLFYTLLAEQGLIGLICIYGMYFSLIATLFQVVTLNLDYAVLLIGLLFYLIFNHTVGSVFVILPAKSVTVTCIAPMLLLCLYFYGKNVRMFAVTNSTG